MNLNESNEAEAVRCLGVSLNPPIVRTTPATSPVIG